MRRNLLRFRDYAKPKFELVDNKLTLKNVPVPPPERILKMEFYRSKFVDLVTMLHQKYQQKVGSHRARMEKVATAILDNMIETINGVDATPVFAYLPTPREIKDSGKTLSYNERFFGKYCKDRDVHGLSLRPHFVSRMQKGVRFKPRGHWGVKGHFVAARAINEYLLANGLLEE